MNSARPPKRLAIDAVPRLVRASRESGKEVTVVVKELDNGKAYLLWCFNDRSAGVFEKFNSIEDANARYESVLEECSRPVEPTGRMPH